MDIITQAKEFASHVHKGHVRNGESKTPFVHHLAEVADLVKESGGSEHEIAAAWLHDAVEDTPTTIEDIRREFGDEIGDMVQGLTDLLEWLPLSLHERKTKQSERVATESSSVRRVKLADQSSNVKLIGSGDSHSKLDERFIYIDRARKIAEACKGISPYLDALFAERYEIAHKNMTVLQEKIRSARVKSS